MPTNLFRITIPGFKYIKLSALFLLSPLYFFAQSLTGLWTGAMSHDSNTVRKDQSFEIALTEYRGKVYGYSRSEFIVNDTLYYILKRVKGTIQEDICEVTDDEIISYNFRGKLDKGVRVTSIFRRNQTDSAWYLDGTWKTNVTKKYYSVTGKIGLQEEKDLQVSKIFPHLEELKLANDVAFYRERKEEPIIARVARPEKIKTEYKDRPQPVLAGYDIAIIPAEPKIQKAETLPVAVVSAATDNEIAITEPQEKLHGEKQPVADLPMTEIKSIPPSTVSLTPEPVVNTIAAPKRPEAIAVTEKTNTVALSGPSAEKKEIKTNDPLKTAKPEPVENSMAVVKKPVTITANEKTNTVALSGPSAEKKEIKTNEKAKPVQPEPLAKTEVKKEQPAVKKQTQPAQLPVAITKKPETKTETVKNQPIAEKKAIEPAVIKPALSEPVKTPEEVMAKAAVIEGRKSEFSQIVSFKADSLELSLYDNGEIDGDTVSVYMNGVVLMSKQGLKASAIKKTIYITPGNEDFTLVLFADNLGKYPPNTGLMVVHDGEDVYNLRFSSDLQKSSGIVFRKKK